ncbi:MAG: dihydrodipicolinate synthase family protein [Lentisphaeria bacterium]|nr:dihydrodipicolinate synthase family protein [Lentisphaeria bacterium]
MKKDILWHGIIVPAVTPMKDPYTVDLTAVQKHFDYMIGGGVNGIFILGTTGEGPAIGHEEQRKFIREAVKAVSGRVPLLVGISEASGADTLEVGKFALEAGADGLVAAIPCYLPPSDEDIYSFYQTLAETFPGKVFIYNMPGMCKVNLKPELVVELLKLEGIAGYKDSSGVIEDLKYVVERTAKPCFVGPEHLTMEAMISGAAGGVNGGANLYPELFANLVKAVDNNNISARDAAQKEIMSIQKIYGPAPCANTCICGLKLELERRGLMQNITAFPLQPLKNPLY